MKGLCIGLFLLSTVASVTVFAENEGRPLRFIQGVVMDERGDALPGASVVVKGTTVGTGTNARGEFSLPLREDREVTLCVSFTGYVPEERIVRKEVPMPDQVFRLMPAENLLNEVVVTGNHVEKMTKDVPVITRVITGKDIEALNPGSIESLLQYELPGLQIAYNSMSQLPTLRYQGVASKYFLFLIDGERISGEGASDNVDLSRFNVHEIERIEVVKGSQSTLYGSNAMGGVINIITKNATRPFSASVSSRYAGVNGQSYSVSVGTKRKRLSSLSSIGYRRRDTYTIGEKKGKLVIKEDTHGNVTQERTSPTTTTIYGSDVWNATQKIGFTLTEKLGVELKGTYYHNRFDVRGTQRFRNIFSDYVANVKVDYIPDKDQKLSFSYIYDRYKKDKDYFLAGFSSTDYRNHTQTARLNYSGTFRSHGVTVGSEFNREYLKHYMLKDSSDACVSMCSLYAQDEWELHRTLRLIMGVRTDWHKKYHWNATPKLSIMYCPAEYLTLRGGWSHGFRSPSLKELFEAYDMGGMGWFMIYGNENLKPEKSRQYSLSAETTFKGLTISVSGFHNRFKDKIVSDYLRNGTDDIHYVNAEKSRTTGMEVATRWNLWQKLLLTGSYAYVDDHQEVNGKNTSYTRPHSITFSGRYGMKFRKVRATLSLNGQWVSRMQTWAFSESGASEQLTFSPRTLCALNMNFKLPRGVSLALGIDNLFNYKDNASDSFVQLPQRGIGVLASLNLNFADMFNL